MTLSESQLAAGRSFFRSRGYADPTRWPGTDYGKVLSESDPEFVAEMNRRWLDGYAGWRCDRYGACWDGRGQRGSAEHAIFGGLIAEILRSDPDLVRYAPPGVHRIDARCEALIMADRNNWSALRSIIVPTATLGPGYVFWEHGVPLPAWATAELVAWDSGLRYLPGRPLAPGNSWSWQEPAPSRAEWEARMRELGISGWPGEGGSVPPVEPPDEPPVEPKPPDPPDFPDPALEGRVAILEGSVEGLEVEAKDTRFLVGEVQNKAGVLGERVFDLEEEAKGNRALFAGLGDRVTTLESTVTRAWEEIQFNRDIFDLHDARVTDLARRVAELEDAGEEPEEPESPKPDPDPPDPPQTGTILLNEWTPSPGEPSTVVPWHIPADWQHLVLELIVRGGEWPKDGTGRSNLIYLFPDVPNEWPVSLLYVSARRLASGRANIRLQQRAQGGETVATWEPGEIRIVYEAVRDDQAVVTIQRGQETIVRNFRAPDLGGKRLMLQVSGSGAGHDDAVSKGWTWNVAGSVR